MPRRLLLVSGSLQARSANRAALDVVRSEFDGHSDVHVIDSIDVGLVPPFNPDNGDHPGTEVESFRSAIAAADVVVISSPEYAGALPGVLKNALDWVVGSGELYGKPVALISAGTSGGEHARQQLIRTLTWQGAHVVGHLGIAAPRTKSDSDGRLVDPPTLAEIRQLVARLLAVLDMKPDERLELVRQITEAAGVEPGHIAPVPQDDMPRERLAE
ncbi:MAG: NADPH-dependent FMN reductase [Ilumatobacteraceae bacterium]